MSWICMPAHVFRNSGPQLVTLGTDDAWLAVG